MQTFTPKNWEEYELLDCGNFEKLERFGSVVIRRPEPQALWDKVWEEIEWKYHQHLKKTRHLTMESTRIAQ